MNELEDFEAFLTPDFNAYKFSNDLLLATNDHDTSEIDIDTSIKRLNFDIDEVEKRTTAISSSNYDSLVSNFNDIDTTNKLIKQKITPLIERAMATYQNIKTDIIDPYDEATKMNISLKKVHTTLNLLRVSNFFFLLVLQIEDVEKSIELEDNKNHTNLVKLAKLHTQISDVYGSVHSDVPIVSIKMIRDYQSIHNAKHRKLINDCVDVIINEFGHNTTFSVSNSKLQQSLIAYYILQGKKLVETVDLATLVKHVNVVSNQLARSLQSPRNFGVVLQEISTSTSDFVSKLTKILHSCEIVQYDKTFTLLDVVLEQLNVLSLSELFWSRLSDKFKRTVASTMARGGPIAKNLKNCHETIRQSINEVFEPESTPSITFIEAVELINRGRK